MYESIAEPYSIGVTHRSLARLAASDAERAGHVATARRFWSSIDRPDLVKELDDEFGSASATTA